MSWLPAISLLETGLVNISVPVQNHFLLDYSERFERNVSVHVCVGGGSLYCLFVAFMNFRQGNVDL